MSLVVRHGEHLHSFGESTSPYSPCAQFVLLLAYAYRRVYGNIVFIAALVIRLRFWTWSA
jgi:hypothetical protein